MSSTIRSYIQCIVLDDFVENCHRQTGLAHEALKDATLEVLAAMLSQEERFENCFENEQAFLGYVKKSVLRRAISAESAAANKEAILERNWQYNETATPEEQVIEALNLQDYTEIIQRVLAKAAAGQGLLDESRQLIETIMVAPDRFIHRRKSGQNKGSWVFNYIALTKELGWNKQRVYDRLERIRKLFLKERID